MTKKTWVTIYHAIIWLFTGLFTFFGFVISSVIVANGYIWQGMSLFLGITLISFAIIKNMLRGLLR